MKLAVRTGGRTRECEARAGESVLDIIQREGIVVDAPCGGAGTCGKCTVLVSDAGGTSYRLACQTPVRDGMAVAVDNAAPLSVCLGGAFSPWPADGQPGTFGLAFDIGTTTVAARLHDLGTGEVLAALGAPNPQLSFGADVITRIGRCEGGGLSVMERLIGEKLVALAGELVHAARVDGAAISRAAIAGNTTMLHIAAGMSPASIGVSPFTPLSLFGSEIDYEPFKKAGIARGRALFAPCISGYVGGDISCGILAAGVARAARPVLFLDLGTNGEMALGSREGILTCAAAAGPVFEGANIKHGMPAYEGAISKVRFAPAGDVECEVIGGGEAVGICGTGLIDAMALLVRFGLVDETGRMAAPGELDDVREDTGIEVPGALAARIGEEDGAPAFRLSGGISITQKDVRNFQLAKAAVCAGIETMLDEAGVAGSDIERLVIAGGFGEYLDVGSAAAAGLFPRELADRAQVVGNSALEGASAILLSHDARAELSQVVGKTSYLELSGNPAFNERYVEDMLFE